MQFTMTLASYIIPMHIICRSYCLLKLLTHARCLHSHVRLRYMQGVVLSLVVNVVDPFTGNVSTSVDTFTCVHVPLRLPMHMYSCPLSLSIHIGFCMISACPYTEYPTQPNSLACTLLSCAPLIYIVTCLCPLNAYPYMSSFDSVYADCFTNLYLSTLVVPDM